MISQFREAVQGRQRSELILNLRNQPLALFEREMLGLEKCLLCMCPSQSERDELRRRIAEDIYFEAVRRLYPWKEFSKALRRLERLGFGDVERRALVAGHFVMWASKSQVRINEAWRMLDDAERTVGATSESAQILAREIQRRLRGQAAEGKAVARA